MQNTGIYIHIPFCRSKCGYCSFNSSADLSNVDYYINALINELEQRSDKSFVCDTVYFGGGTPSVLPRGAINKILSAVRRNYNIAANSEITLEANPESCSADFLSECADSGINRLSLGLQSTDDKLLKIINRPHTYADFLTAVDKAIRHNITNISADLILGLPSQTLLSFEKSANTVAALPLKHISAYALKIEEGTPMYANGVSVDEDLQADMYEKCFDILNKRGFLRYEVSNFAIKGFESKHNLKYWTLAPYLGLGLSAHSFINGKRLENTGDIRSYTAGRFLENETVLTPESLKEEYIMLALRTSNGIDLAYLKNTLGYDLLNEKGEIINNLIKNGTLNEKNGRISLEHKAYYIMNSVIIKLI